MKKPYTHATEVQTLLFDHDLFTAKAAKAWARSHGFRYGSVDEGGPRSQYIRLRQHDPSEYQPGTLRTVSFDEDETIKAVVGVPLRAVAATRPASYDSRGPRRNSSKKRRNSGDAPEFVPFGKLDPRDGYQIDGNKVAFWSSKKDAQAVGRAVGWPARMLTPLHTRFQRGWGFADANAGFLSLDYFARIVAQLPANVQGTLPLGNLRSRLQRVEYERGRTNPRRNPGDDFSGLSRVVDATLPPAVQVKYQRLYDAVVRVVNASPGISLDTLRERVGRVDPGVLLDEVRQASAHGKIHERHDHGFSVYYPGPGSRSARSNPFGKYRGVSYYHTAGVYRAHLPDGTTQVFGAKDGGKRGMQEFIDGFLWAPGKARVANPRRNGSAATYRDYDPPSEWAVFNAAGDAFGIYKARSENAAISQALAHFGVAPEDADPTLRAEPVPEGSLLRWRRTRRNNGSGDATATMQTPHRPRDVKALLERVRKTRQHEASPCSGPCPPCPAEREPTVEDAVRTIARVARSNPARVTVPGLGTGVVVARRPGGMVDVRLSSGMIVRKPSSSLRPA